MDVPADGRPVKTPADAAYWKVPIMEAQSGRGLRCGAQFMRRAVRSMCRNAQSSSMNLNAPRRLAWWSSKRSLPNWLASLRVSRPKKDPPNLPFSAWCFFIPPSSLPWSRFGERLISPDGGTNLLHEVQTLSDRPSARVHSFAKASGRAGFAFDGS